jgi:hypothetical protein
VQGDFNVKATRKPIMGVTYVVLECVLKPSKSGEALEAALEPTSALMKQLDKLDPSKNTLQFYVYPESYEIFKKLRSMAYTKGYDVSWSPYATGETVFLGAGRAPVQ